MAHWKTLANYDYLGAYSLEGIADEVVLTIREVKKERVTATGGNSEDCIVARFEEEKVGEIVVKPMVLNKTNCKTIEALYGGDVENWIGKRIIVFPTTTKFARETVSCLRVKRETPQEPVYKCSVCGKEISKQIYEGSIKKYGYAVCSKECLEKKQGDAE